MAFPHDYMDVGGRAMQEQLPGNLEMVAYREGNRRSRTSPPE